MALDAKGRKVIEAFITGIVAGVSVDTLIEAPYPLVVFAAGVVLALSLFNLRRLFRGLYGGIEVVFGLLVLWDSTSKGRGGFSADFSNDFAKFQFSLVIIQTMGAVYILIRGMDNLTQGVPWLHEKLYGKRV
jgi:hypothetical protein